MDDGMASGKVPSEFFDTRLAGRFGAERGDTLLGPTHGADFGLVDARGVALAMASDPLFFMRALGAERAGWFACHVLLSDVALSGLAPAHLAVSVTLPLDADPDAFGRIWDAFDRAASDAGVSITTGHTGAYEGCSYPTVGGGTALAMGDHGDVVHPTGAAPGDRIIVTKGPAVETVGTLSVLFGDALELPSATVEAARSRFPETSPVADALVAAGAGPVTAMHDATERGLANAVHELAAASDVGVEIERERVPIGEGVSEVCSELGIDPWAASSAGTVVMAVERDGVEDVLGALHDADIRAAAVGDVVEEGVHADGETLEAPETDPYWPTYTALRERSAPAPPAFAWPEPYTSKL